MRDSKDQLINRNELIAITVEELLSPLLFGGTGIVATAQIAATGIPFLASVAMALATMRRCIRIKLSGKVT